MWCRRLRQKLSAIKSRQNTRTSAKRVLHAIVHCGVGGFLGRWGIYRAVELVGRFGRKGRIRVICRAQRVRLLREREVACRVNNTQPSRFWGRRTNCECVENRRRFRKRSVNRIHTYMMFGIEHALGRCCRERDAAVLAEQVFADGISLCITQYWLFASIMLKRWFPVVSYRYMDCNAVL